MVLDKDILQLRDSLNSKGYCVLKNFFHPQLLTYFQITSDSLADLCKRENSHKAIVNYKDQAPLSTYKPMIGTHVSLLLTPLYSKIAQKNLLPSYSFFRRYHKGDILNKHKDRPACQYSVTTHLNRSENKIWDFYVEDINGQTQKIKSEPGDLILYKGEEVFHWRESLKYDTSDHMFLHFVDINEDKYQKEILDGKSGEINTHQVFQLFTSGDYGYHYSLPAQNRFR